MKMIMPVKGKRMLLVLLAALVLLISAMLLFTKPTPIPVDVNRNIDEKGRYTGFDSIDFADYTVEQARHDGCNIIEYDYSNLEHFVGEEEIIAFINNCSKGKSSSLRTYTIKPRETADFHLSDLYYDGDHYYYFGIFSDDPEEMYVRKYDYFYKTENCYILADRLGYGFVDLLYYSADSGFFMAY